MKCIFCPNEITPETQSREHLPPEYLGGFFLVPFVCKSCNSTFGHTIEADLGKNIFIITALEKLGLRKNKRDLYRHADKHLEDPKGKKLKAILDESGKPEVKPQTLENGSLVTPDEYAIESLKKMVERLSKKTGRKICFNTELFKKAKPGEPIPIPGSGRSFVKHSVTGGSLIIEGPKGPIPFRVIGKIAFEHFAALNQDTYELALKGEFDPIRKWILAGGEDQFVLLYQLLRDKRPGNLQYKPFHYVLLRFKDHYFTAIVTLFSTLSFSVFLAKTSGTINVEVLETIRDYHIYDLNKRKIFAEQAPPEHRQGHEQFMDAHIHLRKHKGNV